MKKAFLGIGLTFLLGASAYANPVIKGITGQISEGSKITIQGENFGSPKNVIPLVWDTVENQPTYTSLKTGSPIPTGVGSWTNQCGHAACSPIKYLNGGNARGARNSVFAGKGKGYIGYPQQLDDAGLKKIYVSWWFKPSMDPYAHGGSNKVIRIWDEHDGLHTRISWTSMHLTYYANKEDGGVQWGGWKGNVGQWNRTEILVDANTNTIKTWVNGKQINDIKDFKKNPTKKGLSIGLIGFDSSVPEPYADMDFRMSDIYASGSPARVEISTSPDWASSGSSREIQPLVSWSNNKIEFKVNQGALSGLDKAYLYVVDENGEVNAKGYPLSICTKCPAAPILKVSR